MPEAGRLQRWVEQGWYRRPRPWLRPLSWLYGGFIATRHALYRSGVFSIRHPGVPTIVVGNFTVGGTGKTPLVAWLAVRLRESGRRPGIVLRGFGGRQGAAGLVLPDDEPQQVGDEAVLHARRTLCPVAVGASRSAAARLLVQAGCDTIISDDGLQHMALGRDLEIIVIDGARGFGNGALIPAGPLRERPWQHLHRAAMIVVHGEDEHGAVTAGAASLSMRLAPRPLRQLPGEHEQPLEILRGATVHALAGIGNPARFFALLRGLGASPVEHPRPDHSHYGPGDLVFDGRHPVVMTEKDAVKCRALAAGRNDLFYLPVEAVLSGADAARLLERALAVGRN